jgi:hypothetical protein
MTWPEEIPADRAWPAAAGLTVKRNRIEDMFASNFERWSRIGRAVVWHEQ